MIVVLPMAGRGSRFNNSEYTQPKPLIEFLGKPMFIHALESISGIEYSKLIIVTLKEHEEKYGVSQLINNFKIKNTELVVIENVTEGQLCTVLAARKYFEQTTEDLLIVSSDTVIKSNLSTDIIHKNSACKGIISTINLPGEQWSFAQTDESGKVIKVAEKIRISDNASTGLYYFSNSQEFCTLADQIIEANERTKGEFYVIPVYQKYINSNELITISSALEMWDMGTPDALKTYLESKNF